MNIVLFIMIVFMSACIETDTKSADLVLAFMLPSDSQASQTGKNQTPVTPTPASEPATSVVKPWHSSCCGTPAVMPFTHRIFTFEYSGDLTKPTLSCHNTIVGNEPGRITRKADFSPAGTTSVVQLGLPEGTFWCEVTGYHPKGWSWRADGSGLIWSIYQQGQPDAQWRYRANNRLYIDGYLFEQRGCYQGVGTILNEVTVNKDGTYVVGNNSSYWQSTVCQ